MGMRSILGTGLLLCGLLSGCGDDGRWGGGDFPELANQSRWEPLWDEEKSWIVAFEGEPGASRADLAHRLRRSIVQSFVQGPGPGKMLGAMLQENLRVDVVSDNSLGFAQVSFGAARERMRQLWSDPVAVEWDALQAIDGVRWAEPNLVSRLAEVNEDSWESSPAEPWRRIRVDAAHAFAAGKALTPRQVTVAVLDTGVDFFHPDLRGQMYENPADPVNGIDDDRNDYVDDVCGMDATVTPDPTRLQEGAGAADLGGPGQSCPVFEEEEPRRPGFVYRREAEGCGHGTHVAGIIAGWPDSQARTQVCGKNIPADYQAAPADTALSVHGVCPGCRILSLRVIDTITRSDGRKSNGFIADSSQIRALNYVLSLREPGSGRLVVDVVNMSLGKYFASRSIFYMLRRLTAENVLVAAAAGNDDTDTPSYPGAYDDVLGVCALDTSSGYAGGNANFGHGPFAKATFSNFGYWVDICAPGTRIRSAIPSNPESSLRYGEKDGTSQATPFVAGVLALGRAYFGRTGVGSANELLEFVLRSADGDSLYSAEYNRAYVQRPRDGNPVHLLGAGIVDADRLLRMAHGDDATVTARVRRLGDTEVEGCVAASVAARRPAHTSWLATVVFLWCGLVLALRLGPAHGKPKTRHQPATAKERSGEDH